MRHSKFVLANMLRRPLLLAIVATVAVACVAESEGVIGAVEPGDSAGTALENSDSADVAGAAEALAERGQWSPYKNFTFNLGSDILQAADADKVAVIADRLEQNPALRVGIDGPNARRVSSVRDALIDAGVPASRIREGTFGNPQLRTDGRVDVLVTG
jgi:outer membrane protein OmpA-like peptidoglycan-associated protein